MSGAAQAKAMFNNTSHEASPLGSGGVEAGRSRLAVHRNYVGDMVGESIGDLLVCQTGEGRFGYVGMDLFNGVLEGRTGSFVFQHGEMNEGGVIRAFGFIVTGSGTEDLRGINGDVSISLSGENEHTIMLNYSLAG